MMFGTGGEFIYSKCIACETLFLANPPEKLSEFYPPHYYSFASTDDEGTSADPPKTDFLRRARANAALFDRPWYGRLLQAIRPANPCDYLRGMLNPVKNLSIDSSVLDIGCGKGHLLSLMLDAGFSDLYGVDPYLAHDSVLRNAITITATETNVIPDQSFDLVMMHHVLEHMTDPVKAIVEVKRLLKQNGWAVISLPLASSDVSESYKECWVELDPPRHFTLFSTKGFIQMAKNLGLRLESTHFDTTAFAYWGSELYKQGITLVDPETKAFREPRAHFSDTQLAEFENRAKESNRAGRGGRGTFHFSLRNNQPV
jgi:SAM-dependent methyltransferase